MTAHSAISSRSVIRKSLKRGLAREALRHADAEDANAGVIFEELRGLAPNKKCIIRQARRFLGRKGVVKVTAAPEAGSVTLTFRNVREVTSQLDGVRLFDEEQLIYTRVQADVGKRRIIFNIERLSFCLHALERLVERTDCEMVRILDVVDREAARLLAQLAGGLTLFDAEDCYLTSQDGVWAGSLDRTEPEPEWKIVASIPNAVMSIFSARTFLSETEMRPTVWLRWHESYEVS